MDKNRKTSHILNIVQYDANGHVVLPATLTVGENPHSSDNTNKIPSTSWVRTYVTGLSYQGALTLTTTGSSGAATLVSNTLNIPTYTLSGLGGEPAITVGTTSQYWRGDKSFQTLNTTAVAEGTNLYYTQARFDTAFTAKSTTNLSEGTNLYYTTARVNSDFDTRLATKSTTNLAEGTNLYYTDARVGTYLTNNSYATQSYVSTQINNLVSGAPGLLDTLDELAAALGDDPNFATTVSTALSNRLRIDINNQGLTSTQQGNGRTNLGLGSLAVLSSVGNAQITDVAWSKVTGTPTTIAGYGITDSLVYTTSTYANPAWITSLAWSKITGAPAFITSYTETDTLATVTARGATTTAGITVSGLLTATNIEVTTFATGNKMVYASGKQLGTLSGTDDTIAYWSGGTISSLLTATYPSLTELSYVKGVTSSIQTQLNSKLSSYTETDTLATVTGRGNTTTTRIGVTTSSPINFVTNGNAGTWIGGIQDITSGWSISTNGIGLKADDTTYAAIGLGAANGTLYFGRTTASGVGTMASWLEVYSSGVANFVRARPQYNSSNLALVSEIPTNLNQLTNGPGYLTAESDTLASVTGRGATTSTDVTFGADSSSDKGIRINYGNQTNGYGRIRFLQDGSNHSTIHSFSATWQNGGVVGQSTGAINIDGQNGVTIGGWNSPDVVFVRNGASYYKNSIYSTLNLATGRSNLGFNVAKTILGNIHIQNGAGPSNDSSYQAAITFQGSSASESQAGIYVLNNNSYGTSMGFAVTESYFTGPQLFMTATNNGVVNFPRAAPTVAGNVMWHAGNDGSGSGLDADTVDGYNTVVAYGGNDVRNKILVAGSAGNISTQNPELYSGEVRLGAAWDRGGIYASATLSLSTSSGNIDFVSNDTRIGSWRWDSTNGSRFIVSDSIGSTPYTLIDSNKRPVIYASGNYPVLTLNNIAANDNHGPTVQFTHNTNDKQWVIGTNGSGTRLDIGYSTNTDRNPHNGIAGYQGSTFMRFTTTGVAVGSLGSYPTINTASVAFHVYGDARATGDVRFGRHFDALNTWGTCGCVTAFLGWNGSKVVLGNNDNSGHDYANARGTGTVITTNPHYFYSRIEANDVLRFNESDNRRLYGASLGSNYNAVRVQGNWETFDIMGRVLDWTGSNMHFGNGYNGESHANYYMVVGNPVSYFKVEGPIYATGDIIAYYSDRRLKQNIQPINSALSIIEKIGAYTFEWNKKSEEVWAKKEGDKDFGLISQEVEAVWPMGVVVQGGKDINDKYDYGNPDSEYYDPLHVEKNPEEYKTVRYDKMVTLAIAAIKEQQKQIEELKNKLDAITK